MGEARLFSQGKYLKIQKENYFLLAETQNLIIMFYYTTISVEQRYI